MSAGVVVELEAIGNAPPSFNRAGARGHWAKFHRLKRQWQGFVGTALLIARRPELELPAERIEATATIAFVKARRRDEGNFRALLEKATGDALTEAGWLLDDDAGRFTFGAVELVVEPELAYPETRITLELR